ncbi:MAG TPA: glutamate formimidoyltransferase [Longimicrobiales bacterium]|nr:glutamate formimidoyltransferase [Longimicrobiales bacterium]
MAARILEAVPNFSEGRDPDLVATIAESMSAAGADVLDWSADPDHHRSVITVVGSPEQVEEAAVAAARVAFERIDLRRHTGVHPRIGALDVLPFVPLVGLTMDDARRSARRVGRRLADELGIPVFFYGQASDPPGRPLSALRKGGFEALAPGWPAERVPDLLPAGWPHAGAHPTAGATCVGARDLLLAWNVFLTGISLPDAAEIAARIRERGGGFRGLRALALRLPRRGALQISMNLEDLTATSPMAVYQRIEALAAERGGRIVETEVIGLVPDGLVLPAAADRLRLEPSAAERLLSQRLVAHLAALPGTR